MGRNQLTGRTRQTRKRPAFERPRLGWGGFAPGGSSRGAVVIMAAMLTASLGVVGMEPAWAQVVAPAGAAQTVPAGRPRPPAQDLISRRAFFFARTPDMAALREGFLRTNGGRMLNDEKARPFVSGFWKVLADEFSDQTAERNLDVSLEELTTLPSGEICVAGVALRDEGPQWLMIGDVAPDSDVSERLLLWARTRGETDPLVGTIDHRGYEIEHWGEAYLCRRENTYLVSTSRNLLQGALDLWDGLAIDTEGRAVPTLGKSSQFLTVYRRLQGGLTDVPDILVYADPIEWVRGLFGETAAGFAAMAMIPALGLDGLRAVGASAYFDTPDFDSVVRMHVLLDSPREGVLKAVKLGGVDPTPADFVPEDVTRHLAVQVEPIEMLEAIREVYDNYSGADGTTKWIETNVSRRMGFDFETEFVPYFEGRITYAAWAEPTGELGATSQLVALRMTDAAVGQRLVDTFMGLESGPFPGPSEKANHGGIDYWITADQTDRLARERERRQEERRRRAIEQGREPPTGAFEFSARAPQGCFAVLGDDVVITDNEALMKRAIDAYRGETGRFRDSLVYLSVATKLRRVLGGRSAAMLDIVNNELTLKQWYDFAIGEQAKSFLAERREDNRFLGRLGQTMEESPLPSFEDLQPYLAPSGAILFEEETGFHYMNFTIRRETSDGDR